MIEDITPAQPDFDSMCFRLDFYYENIFDDFRQAFSFINGHLA